MCEVAHTQTGKFELNPAYAEMKSHVAAAPICGHDGGPRRLLLLGLARRRRAARPRRPDTQIRWGREHVPVDLFTYETARDALREIVDKVWGYCERSGIRGRTVTLKVKFAHFQIITHLSPVCSGTFGRPGCALNRPT